MKKLLFLSLILLQVLGFQNLMAQDNLSSDTSVIAQSENQHQRIGFGIGFKASTFGPGGEFIVAITPKIHVRLGGTYLKYSLPESLTFNENINSTNEFVFGGISLLGNYHIGRVFFVSAGAIYNLIDANVSGAPSHTLTIGAIDATPEQIGSLSFGIKPGLKVCPYAGLGLGRSLAKNSIFSFAFEVGAVYHGNPNVTLGATGMLTPSASAEQERTLEENMAFLNFYPMLSFQLSVRIL
ncbi:MAG: hypothetical protein HOO86_14180 [Bacteroidales bacterium]|nr:hypothetical protein [Bacteroidales bacterium]